jgi:hypothetical protein
MATKHISGFMAYVIDGTYCTRNMGMFRTIEAAVKHFEENKDILCGNPNKWKSEPFLSVSPVVFGIDDAGYVVTTEGYSSQNDVQIRPYMRNVPNQIAYAYQKAQKDRESFRESSRKEQTSFSFAEAAYA